MDHLKNDILEPHNENGFIPYSGHYMKWVETHIRRLFPNSILYAPMKSSWLYGEYFKEFDIWRGSKGNLFKNFCSYQGCLIESNNMRAMAMHIVKTDEKSWHRKEYKDNEISLLIMDNTFLKLSWASFYYFIGQQYSLTMTDKKRYEKMLLTINTERDSKLKRSSDFNFNKLDIDGVCNARDSFRKYLYLEKSQAVTVQTKDLLNTISRYSVDLERNAKEEDYYLSNFCESIAIHFLYTHEFGHYCYNQGSTKVHTISNTYANQMNWNNGLLEEEGFCDLLAIDNCWFQQRKSELMPTTILVYMVIWMLYLTDAFNNPKDQNSEILNERLSAAKFQLIEIIKVNKQEMLEKIVDSAISDLKPLAKALANNI